MHRSIIKYKLILQSKNRVQNEIRDFLAGFVIKI